MPSQAFAKTTSTSIHKHKLCDLAMVKIVYLSGAQTKGNKWVACIFFSKEVSACLWSIGGKRLISVKGSVA